MDATCAEHVNPRGLKALFHEVNLKPRDVAIRATLGEPEVRRYFAGKTRLSDAKLKRLLAVLRRELGEGFVREVLE